MTLRTTSAITLAVAIVAGLTSCTTATVKVYDGTEGFVPVIESQQKVPTKCSPLRGEEQDVEIIAHGQGYNSMDRGCI